MTRNKLSTALISMAETALKNSVKGIPSEVAHAALLLARIAWNREVTGDEFLTDESYFDMFSKFKKSHKFFEQYLEPSDWEALIMKLREFKRTHFPHDNRFITSCKFSTKGQVEVVSHDYIGKVKVTDMKERNTLRFL